jgi:hypothetical protein
VSVTIFFRRTAQKSEHFVGGTSRSLEKLKEIFGQIISKSQIDTLRAMAIAADDKFYDEVADTVEALGEIEFWGEN